MKTTLILLLIVSCIVMLCACAPAPAESLSLPNPVVDVDDAYAFDALSLPIDAPHNAQDARYSIISNEIAQVLFALDGISYTYRAAHTTEDISGVYESFDEPVAVLVDADGWTAAITVKTVKGGNGALATWQLDDTGFSLYTSDIIIADTMSHVAMALAEHAFFSFAN